MEKILLIQTGGTIVMKTGSHQATRIDPDVSDRILRESMPELSQIAQIEILNLFSEDSSNIEIPHWRKMAETIEKYYDSFDGFVILHGTDTMAYTASALSFCLNNLGKPVVMTGSQVPLMSLRSDARRNLVNAVEVATLHFNEVVICFNDKVFRGNRTTKMNIGDFDAFDSPNFAPLAEIGLTIETQFKPVSTSLPFGISPDFNDDVFLLKIFPGLHPDKVAWLAEVRPRVIVIEGFGCGNIPVSGSKSLVPFLEDCRIRNILVVMRSQADYDSVDLSKYESGRIARDLGIIGAGDMTTEAAVTKMMYLLQNTDNDQDILQQFTRPIAGEITE